MVETKIAVLRKAALFLASVSLCVSLSAQDMTWKRTVMEGSRTGVRASSAKDVPEAIGRMDGKKYVSPSGKVFRGGATPKVASLILDAQKAMADVKQPIAVSAKAMTTNGYPECDLGDWFVDELMRYVREKYGKKVDFGLANYGGVRVDMPEGVVLKDDILSMFPFKNNVCYLELKGSDLRYALENMAATRWQLLGGVRCVADKSGKLLSCEVGGEPLDDDKTYGVVTISFLLDGGDGLRIARNAQNLEIYPEYIMDVMLSYVQSLTAEGKIIDYQTDGRIQIID